MSPNRAYQWSYYLHVLRSQFVLSPPGAGSDCFRTWEALYLGSIPIVKYTSINSIFEQLPVLSVNNFEDLTLKSCKIYYNMTRRTYDYKRLYKGYWQRQINAFRNLLRTSKFNILTRVINRLLEDCILLIESNLVFSTSKNCRIRPLLDFSMIPKKLVSLSFMLNLWFL